MRKAINKAHYLVDVLKRDGNSDELFLASGMLRLNIESCSRSIIFTDEIIKELYWWQIGKKIFWQRVKIEIYAIKEECVFRLNKYEKTN